MRTFTWLDLAAWVHIAVVVGLITRYDQRWHTALMGAYLRENIPPTALNDPHFPLAYHVAYDAAVALVVRALRVDAELGLDLVTAVCVGVTILCLGAISRGLFRMPALAQASRLLFLYGFGPVFLRLSSPNQTYETLHGQTAQSYVDVLLRRPTALGFALYALSVALLLPLYDSPREEPPAKPWGGARAAALVAVAFLLPQIAEEVTLFAVLLGLPALVLGRLGWRWGTATAFALLGGAIRSGVLWGILGRSSMAAPGFHLVWPPALPSWNHRDTGMGLFSKDGIDFFLLELGPVFLATLVLVAARGRWNRRILLAPFLVGFAIATLGALSVWPKADLDRFLFYGTPLVFMLSVSWIELAYGEYPMKARSRRAASCLTYALTVGIVAVPALFPVLLAWHEPRGPIQFTEPNQKLRRHLGIVGARDPVLTTEGRVFELLEAGFIVVAPVSGATYESIDHDEYVAYVKAHASAARWLFVRSDDPRVQARQVQARCDGFVLVAARPTDGLTP